MRLSDLKLNNSGIVVAMLNGKKERDKLNVMGLTIGSVVTLKRRAMFKKTLIIKVRDFYLAIRKETADKIMVEI